MLRVWSLYNRTWRVGFFLLALLVLESLVVALAWNLPSLVSTLFTKVVKNEI